MTKLGILGALIVATLTAAAAFAEEPASKPSTASAPGGKELKFPSLRVDLTSRQIVIDTEVCLREGPLELLLCDWGTKEHESILHTKAKGAHLHAALLALGLTKGIPAQWSGSDEQARFLPPRGPEVRILLRWKDSTGKDHQANASDWLALVGDKKQAIPDKWVFTGSDVLPDGRYLADIPDNGHVISVSNFPDAVLDVPFESTSSDADLDFQAATEKIPPEKTPVEVVIEPLADAQKSPYARATVEIGPRGELSVEGKPMTPEQLTTWAGDFGDKHPKAQVVLRADGKAMVQDVEQARLQLRYGGLRDFRDEPLPAQELVLPRTADQLETQMEDWQKRFQAPEDYIREPHEHAAEVMKEIQRQTRQLDDLKTLWTQYENQLGRMVSKGASPASQPAKADSTR